MEGTFKNHKVQLPDNFRGNLKLKALSKCLLTTDRHGALPRKPAPVFDHVHSTEIFPTVQCDPPLAALCHSHPCYQFQEQSQAPPASHPQRATRLPLSFLSSRLDSPVPLASPDRACLPLSQFCCPPLDASKDFNNLCSVRSLDLRRHMRCAIYNATSH